MSGAVEIQGDCDRRFEKVRDAFAANFATGREVGASFAATIEGEPVVDLWAGFADGAEYLAVCLPAFSPAIVHRDDQEK